MVKAVTVPRDNMVVLTCRRWHQVNKYIRQMTTEHFSRRDNPYGFLRYSMSTFTNSYSLKMELFWLTC